MRGSHVRRGSQGGCRASTQYHNQKMSNWLTFGGLVPWLRCFADTRHDRKIATLIHRNVAICPNGPGQFARPWKGRPFPRHTVTLAGWTSPRIAEAFSVREDTVRLTHSDHMNGSVETLKAAVATGAGIE